MERVRIPGRVGADRVSEVIECISVRWSQDRGLLGDVSLHPAEVGTPKMAGEAGTTKVQLLNPWFKSWRADDEAREFADRHYNRQKVGAKQFVPPGRCLVLKTSQAFWITSWPFAEYVKHAWPGAWVCSAFRNEGNDYLSSDLIRAAVAATRFKWATPSEGMITFVDEDKVRPKRHPGYCFLKAGFKKAGRTKGGLLAFHLSPEEMPEPSEARD